MNDALAALLAVWPVDFSAAAVLEDGAVVARAGVGYRSQRIASITKVITAYAGLVAVEEGTLHLDGPAGREGSTVRHLLAHAAGYDFNGPKIVASVGSRRIYSNVGIEVLADHLGAAAGMDPSQYITEAVLVPLGMTDTVMAGSPAHGSYSTVDDLARLAAELMEPTLVSAATLAEATTIQFPELGGVLPGFGRHEPNPWGLGIEIKGHKEPHWSGSLTSPRTFGHFGGSGTFLWVDPVRNLACVAVCDREFGDWAVESWPRFNDQIVRQFSSG